MSVLLSFMLSISLSSEAGDINGHRHQVYAQDGEIFYRESDGHGWTEPLNLSCSPGDSSHSPVILTKGEIVRVLWIEGRGGNTRLVMRRKCVGQRRWTPQDVIATRGEEEARELLEKIVKWGKR